MKNYLNTPVKRQVQNLLFTTVNCKNSRITGLAGCNSQEYLNILCKSFNPRNISLVDFEENSKRINQRCISRMPATPIMDCDFCKGIISDGPILLKVFNNMKKSFPDKSIKKILSFNFNFARQGSSKDETYEWLNKNLYNGTLSINSVSKQVIKNKNTYNPYIYIINHNQSKFYESLIIQYRESSQMISGIVSWY